MTVNLISISYKTGFYVKEKRQLKIHATGIDEKRSPAPPQLVLTCLAGKR